MFSQIMETAEPWFSNSEREIRRGRSGLTIWHIRITAGRGQQSRGIRLSVMAMTRRGGEEGLCAFPLQVAEGRALGDYSAHKIWLGCELGWPCLGNTQ
ncbi:UNVERIFIED_CONTAM: hypothetical protein FKN15_026844 [Acipenser sinensis]